MQISDNTEILTATSAVMQEKPYKTDLPGKLKWFESGSEEYQNWVSQRSQFIKEIDKDTASGKEILNDILDSLLESDIPTTIVSGISAALKITKKARSNYKRRQIWYKTIDAILQLNFTAPVSEDDDFILSFHQVQHLWRAFGGNTLTESDYKKLYSTIDTKLRVGKLKNKIIKYPELDRYVSYKLRQFKDSYHRYQLSLIEY